LFRQLSHSSTDPDGARRAFKLLKSPRFAFTRYAQFADQYDPDRALVPGKPVPDFQVTALDGKHKFSPAALRGKLYLIELWGPWCGPCVAEVPLVHAAYEKWSKQGKRHLHILSIAMDTTRDDLAKFHAAGHPMPWDEALAKDDEKRALRAIFGSGVPAYALVDEQGKLLAVPPELRAPGLDRILEDLNKPATK
jgi:thiol-disulfide isomerase/thioredoxin